MMTKRHEKKRAICGCERGMRRFLTLAFRMNPFSRHLLPPACLEALVHDDVAAVGTIAAAYIPLEGMAGRNSFVGL